MLRVLHREQIGRRPVDYTRVELHAKIELVIVARKFLHRDYGGADYIAHREVGGGGPVLVNRRVTTLQRQTRFAHIWNTLDGL